MFSAEGCEEFPAAGYAFELVVAAAFQTDGRAGDQVMDGAGDQDLTGGGEGGDAGSGVHRDAPDLAAGPVFHLPGVQSGADLQAKGPDGVAYGLGAGDGPGRAVEDGQRAVARGVHQPALVAVQLAPQQLDEVAEPFGEGAVPDRGGGS